jgi:hypothetical protein
MSVVYPNTNFNTVSPRSSCLFLEEDRIRDAPPKERNRLTPRYRSSTRPTYPSEKDMHLPPPSVPDLVPEPINPNSIFNFVSLFTSAISP